MSLFGMGPMEMLVILIVALIIFGPGKLPEIAGQAGKAVRDFRRMTRDLTEEFQEPLDEVRATMGEMKATVTDLQKETEALAKSIPESLDISDKPKAKAAPAKTPSPSPVAAPSSAAPPAEAAAPVQQAPSAQAVATKDDPLADLVALDDEELVAPTSGPGD